MIPKHNWTINGQRCQVENPGTSQRTGSQNGRGTSVLACETTHQIRAVDWLEKCCYEATNRHALFRAV